MQSACRMVESRWAINIMIASRLTATSRMVSLISSSVKESIDEVASSNTSHCGRRRRARAIESRCFSPPETFTPAWPKNSFWPLPCPKTHCFAHVDDKSGPQVPSCIAEAEALGEIGSSFDPIDLAEFLLASWEGAILRMKVERSAVALDRFKDIVFETVFSKPNSRSRK